MPRSNPPKKKKKENAVHDMKRYVRDVMPGWIDAE